MTTPYRPSNGSEGEAFTERFCERCRKANRRCKILGLTMVHDVDDPHYPPQWIRDESGGPTCTAFMPRDAPGPPRRRHRPNKAQLSLWK